MPKTKTRGKKAFFISNGSLLLSLLAAMTIIASAYLLKGTENENSWLFITCIWVALIGAFEAYAGKK